MSTVQPYVRSVYQDLNQTFSLGLCDVSYEKVINRSIEAKNVLPSNVIEFKVPQTTAPFVYLLKDAIFAFDIHLTKANKGELTAMPKITVANNILHSLFQSFELKINNTVIGIDYNYMYKAYVLNLLSYNNLVKNAQLRGEGWYSDVMGEFQEVESNGGYVYFIDKKH